MMKQWRWHFRERKSIANKAGNWEADEGDNQKKGREEIWAGEKHIWLAFEAEKFVQDEVTTVTQWGFKERKF